MAHRTLFGNPPRSAAKDKEAVLLSCVPKCGAVSHMGRGTPLSRTTPLKGSCLIGEGADTLGLIEAVSSSFVIPPDLCHIHHVRRVEMGGVFWRTLIPQDNWAHRNSRDRLILGKLGDRRIRLRFGRSLCWGSQSRRSIPSGAVAEQVAGCSRRAANWQMGPPAAALARARRRADGQKRKFETCVAVAWTPPLPLFRCHMESMEHECPSEQANFHWNRHSVNGQPQNTACTHSTCTKAQTARLQAQARSSQPATLRAAPCITPIHICNLQ
jgi:hypothetical protein